MQFCTIIAGRKGCVCVKKLGYMHWALGLLLSYLMQVVTNVLATTVFPNTLYPMLSFDARLHVAMIIVILFPLAVDALWYLLTMRRYSESKVYLGYCLLRILLRIGDCAGPTLDLYEITNNRVISMFYFVVSIAAFILLMVIFGKKYAKVDSVE